jgi:hypothetical protein
MFWTYDALKGWGGCERPDALAFFDEPYPDPPDIRADPWGDRLRAHGWESVWYTGADRDQLVNLQVWRPTPDAEDVRETAGRPAIIEVFTGSHSDLVLVLDFPSLVECLHRFTWLFLVDPGHVLQGILEALPRPLERA